MVVDLLDQLRSPENFRFHFSRARSQSLGDLDLLRFPENVCFHFSRARSQSLDDLVLLAPLLLEADELRDVLDAVDEIGDIAVRSQDRRIDRAPIPLFKSAALGFGPANVVLLHGHGVRHSMCQHPLQGGFQVSDSRCGRIIRIIGKDLKQPAAEDFLALGHRGLQVRSADRHDRQGGRQDEIQPWFRFEQGLKVRGWERLRHHAPPVLEEACAECVALTG